MKNTTDRDGVEYVSGFWQGADGQLSRGEAQAADLRGPYGQAELKGWGADDGPAAIYKGTRGLFLVPMSDDEEGPKEDWREPDLSWETWVGRQSPTEFMELSGTDDAEEAVQAYLDNCPFEIDVDREDLHRALAEYIERSFEHSDEVPF